MLSLDGSLRLVVFLSFLAGLALQLNLRCCLPSSLHKSSSKYPLHWEAFLSCSPLSPHSFFSSCRTSLGSSDLIFHFPPWNCKHWRIAVMLYCIFFLFSISAVLKSMMISVFVYNRYRMSLRKTVGTTRHTLIQQLCFMILSCVRKRAQTLRWPWPPVSSPVRETSHKYITCKLWWNCHGELQNTKWVYNWVIVPSSKENGFALAQWIQ